jgi:hypothetical protein
MEGKDTTYSVFPFCFISHRTLDEACSASLAGLGVFFSSFLPFFIIGATFFGFTLFTQALARWICVDSLLR